MAYTDITDPDNIDPFQGMTNQEATDALASGSPASSAMTNPRPAMNDPLNQLTSGTTVPSPALATQPPVPATPTADANHVAMTTKDAWDSLVMGGPVRENETGVSTVIPPAVPTTTGEYTQQTVDAKRAEAEANQALIDANVAKNDKLADFWTGVTKEERTRLQDNAKFATLSSNLANSSIARNQQMNDEQANIKIDPNKNWNSFGTGGKVQAVIGLMLGGVGQGLMMYGGNKNAHNYALDALDKAIEDDINSQKANKEGLVNAVMAQQGITDNIKNRQKIELLNNHAEWENGHQLALDELSKATAQAQDPIDKANGQIAMTQLQQKIADTQRQWGQHNEAITAAVQARAAGLAKDRLDRSRTLEDAAIKNANDLELASEKAVAEAAAKSGEEGKATFEKALASNEEKRAEALSKVRWYGGGSDDTINDAFDKSKKNITDNYNAIKPKLSPPPPPPPSPGNPSGLPSQK